MCHVIVHTLAETCAALRAAAEARSPVTLHSAPAAAQSLGIGYFLAMVEAARRQSPSAQCLAVLDCGMAPGFALAAFKAGAEAVQMTGKPEVLDKLADIAAQSGVIFLRHPPSVALDLHDHPDPLAAARAFLAVATEACRPAIEPSQND
jgi:hypothetical protein